MLYEEEKRKNLSLAQCWIIGFSFPPPKIELRNLSSGRKVLIYLGANANVSNALQKR